MLLEKIEKSTEETKVGLRIIRSTDSGVSVRVDSVALQSLELLVSESTKAIRGHGVEMGGLILGQRIDWASRTIIITGFVPVEIEHRFGPLFETSQADIQAFKAAAEKVRGSVIGYFRSQIRSGMLIRESDTKLIGELFQTQSCCFAPIETTVKTPSILNLHYLPAGSNPVLTARFPLIDSAILPPAREQQDSGPDKISAPEAKVQVQLPPPEVLDVDSKQSPSSESRKSYRWVIILATAGCAIVGTAFFLGREWSSQSKKSIGETAPVRSTPPDVSLNLRIAATASAVEVRWNTQSPTVSGAARGLLVLFDGPDPQRIELNADQVRGGLYSHAARNSRFSAWLTVYQPNGTFSGETKEALLAITPATVEPVKLSVSTLKTAQPKTSEPKTSEPKTPEPKTSEQKPPQQKPLERLKPAASSPSPASSALLPFTRPRSSMTERTASVPEPLRTPELSQPPKITALSIPALQAPAIHVPQPSPEPALNYKSSLLRQVPAKLLRQVTPSIPANLGSRLRAEVQLDIAVSIDVTGKVTGARVVYSRGAMAGLLAIEALKAAQLSRFAPAQEDGNPVVGNAVLSYRIAPNLQ